MIQSKEDLYTYLSTDKKALNIEPAQKRPRLFRDEVWRFQIALRKAEYEENCSKGILGKVRKAWTRLRFHRQSVKCGFSIPLNVFGPGLSIAHYGTIVVNSNAKIGKNCRVQEGVTIGSSGSDKAPVIGDNVFIGSGAKIIGDIEIADNIAVGAGAVVTKSFIEPSITIAGVPACKISNKNSSSVYNMNSTGK